MKAIGYYYLKQTFDLKVSAPLEESYLHEKSCKVIAHEHGVRKIFYPAQRMTVAESWQGNLLFAVKHEGVNLEILRAFFARIGAQEMAAFVKEKPTGVYHRRIWFFYEYLTDTRLSLEDVESGNYVDAVDAEFQVALPAENAIRVRRFRVIDNLIGNREFCPFVRLTEPDDRFSSTRLKKISDDLIGRYSPDLIYRAVRYLYVKETKSSFAIERETPDQRRMESFVALLKGTTGEPLTKELLVGVQNRIVDARYAQKDCRTSQVYVGETVTPDFEKIHFIAAKPMDVGGLMNGFIGMVERWLSASSVDPVIAAAVISFAFVFIHPFEDGNGRIHRYLMHYVLSRAGFAPGGLVFPISAVLLKKPSEYDQLLESYSKRLMACLDYVIDDEGEVTVKGDSADFYRYIDFTPIVDGFRRIMRETIETEWKAELDFLKNYDRMRKAMREIVDMPEKKANQFIMFTRQNGGKLPRRRREYFSELNDDEIAALENVVGENPELG